MRVRIRSYISPDGVSRMGNRGHGEGNRFSESRAEPSGRGIVGINYRKVQPSKIQLFPRVCALAFEIASLKYENYCPWLRSVSLATCITSTFLIFQASFLSTAGIHAVIGIVIARVRERENLAFRCCTTSVTNARTACAVCFDLLSRWRKYFFVRPIRKSKSTDKKRAFQYLLFLPPRALRAVRTCVRARVHACVRFFRVASCGSLTFELSNRLEATTVSEYHPVIAPGYESWRLTRRVLGAKSIQSSHRTVSISGCLGNSIFMSNILMLIRDAFIFFFFFVFLFGFYVFFFFLVYYECNKSILCYIRKIGCSISFVAFLLSNQILNFKLI